MKQSEIRPPRGARHKRKRVGRGNSSGHGTYSGRGIKGQKARSGGGVRLGFEGGQLPLIKRLPQRRGFTNIFKKEYSVVNVARLNMFPPGAEVTPQELFKAGLIKSPKHPVKILGGGALQHPLFIRAEEFSAAAQKKITSAGGEIKRI
jgi:large subunit ribosomal protein L15